MMILTSGPDSTRGCTQGSLRQYLWSDRSSQIGDIYVGEPHLNAVTNIASDVGVKHT